MRHIVSQIKIPESHIHHIDMVQKRSKLNRKIDHIPYFPQKKHKALFKIGIFEWKNNALIWSPVQRLALGRQVIKQKLLKKKRRKAEKK